MTGNSQNIIIVIALNYIKFTFITNFPTIQTQLVITLIKILLENIILL
jgi:hypothetical protein